MVSAIDMGLDDIIKSNKKAKKTQATARGKGRGGRARGARAGNRANGATRNTRNNQGTLRRTRGGGVGQRRGNRGNGRANGSMMRSARPAANGARGAGGIRGRGARGRGGRAAGRGLARGAANGAGRALPGKITVRNLQWSVSDDDIKELFSQFGELKTSAIHYDRTGRSLGVADVTFRRSTDADKACNKYNNVPLDGRPMKIEVVGKKPAVPVSTRLGPKPKQQQQQNKQANGRGGGARRGRGKGRGGQGRQPKKEISAEELDSQLEAYISNKMDVE